MNFLEIVKNSFEITWRNKKLWILGIFASLAAGSNLNFSNPFSGSNFYQFRDFNWNDIQTAPQNPNHAASGLIAGVKDINYSAFFENHLWLIIVLISLLFLLFICIGIFSIISRAGLIDQIFVSAEKKEVFVKAGIITGWHRFWQFFTIIILITLGVSIPLIIIIGLAILIIVFKVYILLAIIFLLFLMWLILTIYLSIINTLAFRFCIDQNQNSITSLRSANELFKAQFKNILLFWLIELGLKIGIAIIFGFVALILLLFGVIICVLAYFSHIFPLFLIIMTLAILFLILVIVLFNGVILTFFDTYWSLIYLELKKKYL